jgi:two-component system, NarL family, invasion response regulator UvrY
MQNQLKFLIIDDDALVRGAVKALIQGIFPTSKFSCVATFEEALEALKNEPWDIAVMDLSLGRRSGHVLIREFRTFNTTTPVLILSSHEEMEVAVPVLQAGANGFLPKEQATNGNLEIAISTLLQGRTYVSEPLLQSLIANARKADDVGLSPQEKKVLVLIASGHAAKQVAGALGLSEKTVRTYRARICEKLGVTTDSQIIRYSIQHGLID